MLLAVLFSDQRQMLSSGATDAFAALKYWGVPFATRGSREGSEIWERFPRNSVWIVCDSVDAALLAQRDGCPVVFVGSNPGFKVLSRDIAIATLYDLADSLRPLYTEAALRLRDVIASEFESS